MQQTTELERAVFAERVLEIEGLLFTVGYAITCDRELTRDAVQESLCRAWARRGTLRDQALFKAWLVQILKNTCMTMLRRRGRPEAGADAPPEAADGPRDARLDVDRAVRALPERLRLPVALFYFERLRVSEIAPLLGIPEGTVKARLHEARQQLKKELSDYGIA